MYAANSYVLRLATDTDAPVLSRLADLDGKAPLDGSILIGELHGAMLRKVGHGFVPIWFRRYALTSPACRGRATQSSLGCAEAANCRTR